jgi:hypothetical protein
MKVWIFNDNSKIENSKILVEVIKEKYVWLYVY